MAALNLEFFAINPQTRLAEIRWNSNVIGNAEQQLLLRFKPVKRGSSNRTWKYMQIVASDEQFLWLHANLLPSNIQVLRERTDAYIQGILSRQQQAEVAEAEVAEAEVVEAEKPMLLLVPAVEPVTVEAEAEVVEAEVVEAEVAEAKAKTTRARRGKKVA
jgi:nitrogenase subunit NifH